MTSVELQALVTRELVAWRAPDVPRGSTVGIPWTAKQYQPEIERLRSALVLPYEQRFELRETDELDQARWTGEAVYWVVAETQDMLLWYDERTRSFGVGEPAAQGDFPRSIGLRGDIVGSFCAW